MQVQLTPQLATRAPVRPGISTPVPAGITVPLRADIQDKKQLSLLRQLGGRLADPRVSGQVFTEAASILSDVAKLEHPEWHSGLDPMIGWLAVGGSGLELWLASQKHDETQMALSGAQFGANLIDLIVGTIEMMGTIDLLSPTAALTLRRCALFIKTAAGIAKIGSSVR